MPNQGSCGCPWGTNPNMGMQQPNPHGPTPSPTEHTCPPLSAPVNVVHKCFVERVPQVCNYHTHIVNTVVRKAFLVPTFSCSSETVFVNECCQGPTTR